MDLGFVKQKFSTQGRRQAGISTPPGREGAKKSGRPKAAALSIEGDLAQAFWVQYPKKTWPVGL